MNFWIFYRAMVFIDFWKNVDGSSVMVKGWNSMAMFSRCRALQILPDSVGNLAGLRSLVLGECHALWTQPDSVGKLTVFQSLDLEGCHALQMLLDSVGDLKGFQILQLRRCSNLQVLPKVEHLRSLVKLDVSGCPKLQCSVGVFEQLRQRLGEGFSEENFWESFSEESE